jgi:uncharacterized protein YxeA
MRKIIAVVRMLTLVVVATSFFCTNISFTSNGTSTLYITQNKNYNIEYNV